MRSAFSAFYLAMFVVLAALILRPVGFKYRSKRQDPRWRSFWDYALFVGGFVPALIFGVAVGNVLVGAPFRIDETMRIFWEGSFFGLLNPFALLCGLLSVSMLFLHGAAWLSMKAEHGPVRDRARALAPCLRWPPWCCSRWAELWVAFADFGYVASAVDTGRAVQPAADRDSARRRGLAEQLRGYPWMIAAPLLGFGGGAGALGPAR
jgi:cytochrome d ubiquinol oxidase subunit II